MWGWYKGAVDRPPFPRPYLHRVDDGGEYRSLTYSAPPRPDHPHVIDPFSHGILSHRRGQSVLGGVTTTPELVGRSITHAAGAHPDVAEHSVPGGIPQ